MRNRIALLAAVVILLTVSVPIVLAGTQYYGSPCTGNKWIGYENAIGDTSDGDDRLYLCNFNQGVLGDNLDIQHSLAGTCKAPVKIGDDWANCLSSYYVTITDSTRALCLYSGWNYTGDYHKITSSGAGVRQNLSTFNLNDTLASFKWIVYNASCL